MPILFPQVSHGSCSFKSRATSCKVKQRDAGIHVNQTLTPSLFKSINYAKSNSHTCPIPTFALSGLTPCFDSKGHSRSVERARAQHSQEVEEE